MKKIILGLMIFISLNANSLPVNYYEIKNTQEMKKVFFNFILEISQKENALILSDRKFIKDHFQMVKNTDQNISTNIEMNKRFSAISKRYKLKENSTLKDYLKKVDVIPNSMVLAQAAVESGWGKSRFFKKAKNIFGQWTWSGKGLDPAERVVGTKHKIKIFPSFQVAVKAYMINLNLGWGYSDLRMNRELTRQKGKNVSGYNLSGYMQNYSAKKEEYGILLQKIIKRNNLSKYDIN